MFNTNIAKKMCPGEGHCPSYFAPRLLLGNKIIFAVSPNLLAAGKNQKPPLSFDDQ